MQSVLEGRDMLGREFSVFEDEEEIKGWILVGMRCRKYTGCVYEIPGLDKTRTYV